MWLCEREKIQMHPRQGINEKAMSTTIKKKKKIG
jgi:hypothetical protein